MLCVSDWTKQEAAPYSWLKSQERGLDTHTHTTLRPWQLVNATWPCSLGFHSSNTVLTLTNHAPFHGYIISFNSQSFLAQRKTISRVTSTSKFHFQSLPVCVDVKHIPIQALSSSFLMILAHSFGFIKKLLNLAEAKGPTVPTFLDAHDHKVSKMAANTGHYIHIFSF